MPPEELALLAAVIADPEDDTPRLAYADWLEENADSLPPARRESARARATLIRLQVEHAGFIVGSPEFEERDFGLVGREQRLTHRHHKAWLAELKGVTLRRGVSLCYDRGLLGHMKCSVKAFVDGGTGLFDAAPVTSVRLTGLGLANFPRLIGCEHLERVRTLKFDAAETPVVLLAPVLSLAPLGHLRGLHCDSWRIDETTTDWQRRANPVANLVATHDKFAALRHLSLCAAGVSQSAGRALANAAHLGGLEVLDLRHNHALRAAKSTLRKRFGKRVWLSDADTHGFAVRYLGREPYA
jgi:uncharacterized protein (TIGR02996 family)